LRSEAPRSLSLMSSYGSDESSISDEDRQHWVAGQTSWSWPPVHTPQQPSWDGADSI
jgi:hypothetical protein